AAPLVPFAAPALPVAGSGDTAATAIVPTTLPAAAAEPAAGSASPRPTETAMAAAPLPDAVTVPTERPAPSASAETRKGAIPAPVGRAAAQLALAEPAAAPLAAAVAALPSVTPRRTPSLPAASDDAVAPAKGSDNAAPITDIALPLAPRPMPVAAPLAPAPDLAPSVSAAAPLDPAPLAEPLIEHQLDMAREGEWLDQLTRDIVRTASAEGSLRFRLNPEHLGSLQVEVTQGQAGASVRLTADTEQARSLIADARPQLIAEARAQGVRIAEAHVDLSGRGESQGGGSPAHSQAGTGGRGGRDVPAQEYLTSWQPESAEEEATPSRRASAERYA
ncbi:MAG: flagellar hook-length control protein FliK, partial [Sphingomonadaceae bacterium]|nr:flagellar hook-length control protein FliK [Sphingomonadaceae bacterium]